MPMGIGRNLQKGSPFWPGTEQLSHPRAVAYLFLVRRQRAFFRRHKNKQQKRKDKYGTLSGRGTSEPGSLAQPPHRTRTRRVHPPETLRSCTHRVTLECTGTAGWSGHLGGGGLLPPSVGRGARRRARPLLWGVRGAAGFAWLRVGRD